MTASLVLGLCLAAGLAQADELSATLERLGGADLVMMSDPAGARPVRVLLATQVSAPPERLRQVVSEVGSYRKAMPSFRRTDVLARRSRGATVADLQVAWELEIPGSNLTGRLWLRPQADGVDLELAEGDFSPGIFHVRSLPEASGKRGSILTIDGHANLGDAHWALHKLVRRSPLVEPVMTVAATYVMLRALAALAENASPPRPTGAMSACDVSTVQGWATGRAAGALSPPPKVFAAIHRQAGGRLAKVEVALPLTSAPEDASGKSLHPESFRGLPGWKKVTPVSGYPDECKDPSASCWAVESNLPMFAIGGTWKVWAQPWRARMVAGESKGAVLGLDFVPGQGKARTTLVVSQHPRIDQAGFLARRLIAAEPWLEHGLSLALTIVEAVSLAPALEGM